MTLNLANTPSRTDEIDEFQEAKQQLADPSLRRTLANGPLLDKLSGNLDDLAKLPPATKVPQSETSFCDCALTRAQRTTPLNPGKTTSPVPRQSDPEWIDAARDELQALLRVKLLTQC